MTIKEIVSDLWLKCFCISAYTRDTIASKGIIDEVLEAKIDKELLEIAIVCLKRTHIYIDEQTRDIDQGTLLLKGG